MLNILNKKMINDINRFLTTGSSPDSWQNIKGEWGEYGEYNNPEWSPTKILVTGLLLFPDFDNDISINRDNSLKCDDHLSRLSLYKYNDKACSFDSFNISRLNPHDLNDKKEGWWLNEYVKSTEGYDPRIGILFDKMISKYNVLAAYTTTTTKNHQYMISNYSKTNKQAVEYKGDEIINSFDSLFSSKIKPLRGFIRYGSSGKNDLLSYIQILSRKNPKGLSLLIAIANSFVKGICMSEEAEYRFLIITSNNLDSVSIHSTGNICHTFPKCPLIAENPYYSGLKPGCSKITHTVTCPHVHRTKHSFIL